MANSNSENSDFMAHGVYLPDRQQDRHI